MVVMQREEGKNGAIGAMIPFTEDVFLGTAAHAARVMGTAPSECSVWIDLRNSG